MYMTYFPPGGSMFDDRIMQSRQSFSEMTAAHMKGFPMLGSGYPRHLFRVDYGGGGKSPRSAATVTPAGLQLQHDPLLQQQQDKPLSLVTRLTEADDVTPEVTSPSLEEAEEEDFEEEEEEEEENLGTSDSQRKQQQQLKTFDGSSNLGLTRRSKDKGMDLKSFMYDKKTFNCQHCKYVTDRKNNLKRHIATMHEKCGKLLECCDTIFANKAVLREHVVSNHKHGYDCRVCGRNFCRKALLKRHVTVHSGQKDYVCQTCGYATSHKSNLDRHKKRHLPKESRAHHRYPSMPHHHHHNLSLELPKLPQMTIGLHVYHETYSDFLDGRLGAISPLRTSCTNINSELQLHGTRSYSEKNFFKKRLIYDYMFERDQNGSEAPAGLDDHRDPAQDCHSPTTEPSDSGSESPREALPSRETDTTESPFVSPSNTDSPENSFEFPVFSSGEVSPSSLDLSTTSDQDTVKSRLFPRLHRCRKCRRVFQTQLQLAAHAAHAHALSRWTKTLADRPLSVEFRRKPKNTRRLPSFLFS